MAGDDPIRLIYSTFGSLDAAEKAGRALVERRLAACVNILPGMVSIYEWQGALDRDEEVVMITKTRAAIVDEARRALAEIHPYETPAILTLATEHVSAPYAAWLREQTAAKAAE
jgi:periplasmic divalent cation tolerance protein